MRIFFARIEKIRKQCIYILLYESKSHGIQEVFVFPRRGAWNVAPDAPRITCKHPKMYYAIVVYLFFANDLEL